MPFELGIEFGLRNSSKKYVNKRALILETNKYDYMEAISDLNGYDIKNHEDDPEKLIMCIRSWLSETAGERDLESSSKVYTDYILFQRNLYDKKVLKYADENNPTEAEEYAANEIEEMTIPEYIDEVGIWIDNK